MPQLGPFDGSYSDIVQDPNDPGFASGDPSSLVSARVEVGGPFAQVLADGTFLYTEPYTFDNTIFGLPYPVGTELIGRDDAQVRVQLGTSPDPTVDPVVGVALAGGVVTVTRVIPEPSAMCLVLICLGFSLARSRSRRR